MTDKIDKMRASGWKAVNEVEKFPDHIREWAYQLDAAIDTLIGGPDLDCGDELHA